MYIYRLVFLLVLAIYIFSPNILDWWTSPENAWYSPPFVIWGGGLIAIGFWLEWRRIPMSFSATGLLLASLFYLIVLFGIAWGGTERGGTLLRRWVRHPLIYTLSLGGVYAGIWAVYGAIGMAADSGYGFLAYYLASAAPSCWHRFCSTRFSA